MFNRSYETREPESAERAEPTRLVGRRLRYEINQGAWRAAWHRATRNNGGRRYHVMWRGRRKLHACGVPRLNRGTRRRGTGGGGSGEMTSDFEAQGGIEYKAFFPALPRPVSVSQTSSRPTCSVYFKTRKCTSLLSGLELFLLALLVSCLSVCTYSSKVAFYGRVEISLRY